MDHKVAWENKIKLPRDERYPFNHPADFQNYTGLHQNDYMRLSEAKEVVDARVRVMQERGTSFLASTVYSGANKHHSELKELLAYSMRSEEAVLASTGWTANVGLIDSIAVRGKPIYIDQKAHASLWDGARLAGAKIIICRHNRPEDLEKKIQKFGPGIVCIDSFYSANGAVADLKAYVEICEELDSILVLDEAHSFALLGENGGGLAVELGLAERVAFRTISFSKGLGGFGGAIACSKELAWWLTHRSHPIIFSSSVMPSESAANCAALKIVMKNPSLGRNCLDRAQQLREILNFNSIDTGESACQIVSIEFESGDKAINFYHSLKRKGILSSVFLFPAVALNTGLIRFSIYSTLTPTDIERIAEAIIQVTLETGLHRRRQPLKSEDAVSIQ